MRDNLKLLLSDGIIDEVLSRLMSGKEADVFCVRYRGEVVAAKVYKDREQRSFKNNSAYKEGRKVRNSRTQRAMDKGSRFGRDEAEDAWKASESRTLHTLHTQGVRVPNPVLFYDGVLLMEIVTDADGDPAPRLIDAQIDPAQAGALYQDLRRQIIGILCCDLIHGDLSPYNILLGAAGPTIIDFPQTLSAAHNTQAERFFHRDFDNVLRFLASFDRRLGAHGGDARAIWRAYVQRDLTPDFVPTRAAPPPPPPPRREPEARWQGDRAPQAPRLPREDGWRPQGPRPQGHDGRRPQGAPAHAQHVQHAQQDDGRRPQGAPAHAQHVQHAPHAQQDRPPMGPGAPRGNGAPNHHGPRHPRPEGPRLNGAPGPAAEPGRTHAREPMPAHSAPVRPPGAPRGRTAEPVVVYVKRSGPREADAPAEAPGEPRHSEGGKRRR